MKAHERKLLDTQLKVPMKSLFRSFATRHNFQVTEDELEDLAQDLAESATDSMFSYSNFAKTPTVPNNLPTVEPVDAIDVICGWGGH